jgi:hypothetical protein
MKDSVLDPADHSNKPGVYVFYDMSGRPGKPS